MEEKRGNRLMRGLGRKAYGKILVRLHAWNAWLLLLLTISGILLFAESIRSWGEGRSWIKQAHLVLGAASMVLLLGYLPLLPKHWKQLKRRMAQRWNLLLVLLLLAGWVASGLLLWAVRALPPGWGNAALWIHDAFTWIGVPYAVYHSVSRSRWVKAADRRSPQAPALAQHDAREGGNGAVAAANAGLSGEEAARADAGADAERSESPAQAWLRRLEKAPISRGTFLRLAAGVLLIFGVGPSFYRWLKQAFDEGGTDVARLAEEDANRMLPPPEPTLGPTPPVGGGGDGQFRVYTVTDIPSFTSESWRFAVSGLVKQEQLWNWEQFLQLPRTVQVSDFHCITGWSVYHVTWEGIRLADLLDLVGVGEQAKFVKFYSGDRIYTDCLSLKQARLSDVMVAVLMDGKPIPQKLGGPVRLVVPQMYAYKSVKWLQGLELIEQEHIGYWEDRGYDQDGWVPGRGGA